MFVTRMREILDDKNPFYDAYQPDNDPAFSTIKHKTLRELTDHLATSADAILGIVKEKECLLETRRASHSKFGTLNAKEWVEFFMLHAMHHWYDVQKQVLLNRK